MRRFESWKEFARRANKSVSSLKRDAAEDRLFPMKIDLGPNRVGFADIQIDAWLELLLVRHMELEGAFNVSQRKRKLEAILRGEVFMDESAANSAIERRHQEGASATRS